MSNSNGQGKFKVGDKVIQLGTEYSPQANMKGTVIDINDTPYFPIIVKFDDGKEVTYTLDGARYSHVNNKKYCYIAKLTKLEQIL